MSKRYLDDDWQNRSYYDPDPTDVVALLAGESLWDEPELELDDEEEYQREEAY